MDIFLSSFNLNVYTLLLFSAICFNYFQNYTHLNTQWSYKRLIAYTFNVEQKHIFHGVKEGIRKEDQIKSL